METKRSNAQWTFVVTSIALLMVVLDNLVVTTALPIIRRDLNATLEGLEWTVNAYTLTFAVLLLTGAALGDRFGRRRMFVVGVAIFTVASAFAASVHQHRDAHHRARPPGHRCRHRRAADPDPPERGRAGGATRTLPSAAWGAVGGLAVALGPLVGGAIVEGLNWHWIFWLNVPIGLVLRAAGVVPPRREPTVPPARSTCPAWCCASFGLLAVVWAVIKRPGSRAGQARPSSASMAVGIVLLVAFGLWERRSRAPDAAADASSRTAPSRWPTSRPG